MPFACSSSLRAKIQHGRRDAQHAFDTGPCGGVEAARHQTCQMAIQRADRRRNRHVVVVQDDQQRHVVFNAGVVHCLEGHAGRHRAVADHGDAHAIVALQLAGDRHAERSGDRSAGVRGTEGVVLRLIALREALEMPPNSTQRVHLVAAAGQDLVRVGLMADVPDNPVTRRVEHVVQRNGQLDRAGDALPDA